MSELECQQFIFGSIFLLANKLQLLGDRVTGELTMKQWLLLNIIQKMEKQMPNYMEIAQTIGTTRQNISKMLSVLEAKGMVTLKASPTDRRAVHVLLNQQSRDYFNAKNDAGELLLAKIFAGVSPEDSVQMARMIGQLLGNTEAALQGQSV